MLHVAFLPAFVLYSVMAIKSTTTLLTGKDVCELADIPRSTLPYWIDTGIIPAPKHELGERKTPVFTRAEAEQIAEIAKERRQAMNVIRRK